MAGRISATGILAVIACLPVYTNAQDAANYPSKAVRVIVGLAPGGAVDSQARMFSHKASESLRQPFVVENRPSGGGTAAMDAVARAAPDGYTLLAVSSSFTLAPALTKNLAVDPIKDFVPVSLLAKSAQMLVVHPSLPAKSVKEFIALAKSRPGKLNLGGSPTGSNQHIAALWLFSLAGIDITYIAYKGGGPALTALMGGEIEASLGNMLAIAPHVISKKVRALGVSTAQRSALFPDLPTISEQGVPGYDFSTFHGWLAPAGTPVAVVAKLSAELARIAKSPEVSNMLGKDGGEPVGSSAEQFRQFIAAEVPRWRKVVQENGIKAE